MNSRAKIRNMLYISLGAVILAVCSWISIPTPLVPFTLQTFGVFFLIYFFGAKRGAASLLVYIALGAVGVPVFAGFGAGLGVLLGPTGGYILGFLASGGVYIAVETIFGKKRHSGIVASFLAILACYAVGSARAMSFVESETDFLKFFVTSASAFGIFDCIKIIFAFVVAKYMKRIMFK